MNRIYKGLLSSIISLMMVITTSLIPGLFNFESVSAVGEHDFPVSFVEETGVYDLVLLNGSTNDHTIPRYLWEENGKIFVAFTFHNNRRNNDGSINGPISIAGVSAQGYYTSSTATTPLIVEDDNGVDIINETASGKTGSSNYRWLVAFIDKPANFGNQLNLVVDFTANGHALDANYQIVGAINVEHVYGSDDPIIDVDQSEGSSIGGLTGTITIQPKPKEGFEYDEVTVVFDSTEVLSTTTGVSASYNDFDEGTLSVDGAGIITLTLTDPFNKEVFVDYHYTPIDYTFTFDPNWGSEINVEETFNIGGSVTAPTFTRTGYTFDGWTEDEEGLTAYTSGLTNLPAEDIYVYAQWSANQNDVYYDANGGSGTLFDSSNPYDFGSTVTVLDPSDGTIEKEGYSFDEWTENADGSGESYNPGETFVMPDNDKTLFAQWSINQYNLTINYEYEDGSEAASTVTDTLDFGASYSEASPSISGYTPNIATVSGTMPANNVEVTVVYSINQYTLTINYEYEDGSEAASTVTDTLDFGASYSEASPSISGYTPNIATVSGTMPANNVEVTVVYSINQYTLTINYEYEDGSEASSTVADTLDFGSSYSVTSPSISGYTPDIATVSGTMPASNVEVTVTYSANNYTLTINYVDENDISLATSYEDLTMNINDTYSITSPVITGYSTVDLIVSGTMPADDVTIKVVYTLNDYTFTFDPNGGEGSNVVRTFSMGDDVVEPTFEKEGYTFVGWYLDSNGTDEYVSGFTDLAPNDVYVYAKWQANDYTLTVNYVVVGGNATAPTSYVDTLNFEDDYNVSSPELEGYTVDRTSVIGTMPSEDVVETVIYTANPYTLTVNYVVIGGNATAPTSHSEVLYFEDDYTVNSPELEGYTVDTAVVSGTMPSSNVTKTVTYTAVDYTLTVNYVVVGGNATAPTSYVDTLNFEDDYNVSSPELEGYTVDRTSVTGTMPSEDVVETVIYTAVDYTLTVNYVVVGGSAATPTSYVDTLNFEDDYNVVSPFLNGYSVDIPVAMGSMPSEDLTITVTYTAIDYILSYVTNMEGLTYPDDEFNVGEEITPPQPNVPGYNFLGWYWYSSDNMIPSNDMIMMFAVELSDPELELFPYFDNMPPMDVTVYAQWEAIDYTFTFDPNFGEEANVEQTFNVGGSVEGTSFTRTGYEFVGWTIDEEGSTAYTGGLTDLPAEDIYVYAQWEAIDYTFTFDPNYGDESVVEQTFNVGGSVAGTSFTRTGYEFVGWTTDALGESEYTGGLVDLPAQDIYVYAQWEAIDYTFTFDPNFGEGANVEQTFNVGGSVEGTSFTRDGFIFDGWTLDEEGLTAYTGGLTNLPAEDIYVYAQWEELPEDEFVLTYVTNQPGLTIPSVVFIEGDSITSPEPEFEGFVFDGWFIDEDLLVEFDQFDSMPAQNVTVYAAWGEVLGDEEEYIPDMSDDARTIHLGLFFLILGMLTIIASKKEEEYV